jgi:outer membrane protein assembly factor BamB
MYMHDPQHTGRSPYSGPQKPRIKWMLDVGAPITSSPTIGADGTLYVGSVKGKLFAVTPSGEVKWTVKTGNELDSSRLVTSDGTSSPAVGSDGTVYVGAMDGKLYAVTPSGEVKWTMQAAAAPVSSPAIGPDGTIYVGSGGMGSFSGSMGWALYAVTPAGQTKWNAAVGAWTGSCSPAIGPDGTVYIGSGGIDAVTPAGQVKWNGGVGAPVFSSPAVSPQGTVFITSVRTVAAYTPSGKMKRPTWRPASWKLDDAGEGWCSPVIGADGTVYVAQDGGLLFALTPAGKVKWTVPTASGMCHLALDAGGTVYVACWEGQLYAVTPLGKVKWTVETGDVICSSPAIGADGTLYVGSRLCTIGEESGESEAGSE